MDATEEITAQFNERMCERIAERIVALYDKTGEVKLIPSTRSDINKMIRTGRIDWNGVMEEVQRFIPDLSEEVKKAFIEAGSVIAEDVNQSTREVIADDIELSQEYDRLEESLQNDRPTSVKSLPLTDAEINKLDSAYRRTDGTVKNLTRTTASEWQETFINACDNAFWEAQHGVSPEDAIRHAIDECAKYGTHVVYPSGHKDTIEVAVRRAVRTGIAQAMGDITLTRCAESGINHVLVSSHADARVTDKVEPANHQSWQGKVYQLNWKDDTLKDYDVKQNDTGRLSKFLQKVRGWIGRLIGRHKETYPDFVTVTGYGTGPGLCGWNCRHSFSPFIPDVNTNNQKQYDAKEVERRYNLTQDQRKMERGIRRTKRRLAAARAAEDEEKVSSLQNLLHTQHDGYMEFCKKNSLKPATERFYIP